MHRIAERKLPAALRRPLYGECNERGIVALDVGRVCTQFLRFYCVVFSPAFFVNIFRVSMRMTIPSYRHRHVQQQQQQREDDAAFLLLFSCPGERGAPFGALSFNRRVSEGG